MCVIEMKKVDNKTVRGKNNWSVTVNSIHELKYLEGNKSLTLEIEGGQSNSGIHWNIYSPTIWGWDENSDDLFIDEIKYKLLKKEFIKHSHY